MNEFRHLKNPLYHGIFVLKANILNEWAQAIMMTWP
jgi:hypothetical protein